MTDQRQLDYLLDAFLAEGPEELPDRVIDAALDQIDYTRQRRGSRLPWRLQGGPVLTRVAAAAFIGVLAIGGALYMIQPGEPAVGVSHPTPAVSHSPSATAGPTPSAQPGPTGPIAPGRQIHTATLLADGRVLVAGGYDLNDAALASAELYDPKTGRFSPTGSLATARGLHTATLLADGRVLIAGGGPASWLTTPPGPYLATAELYDPATGKFSPTGSMTTTREDHTATLLADGRVLIAGGNDYRDQTTNSAEIYDPKTGKFTATGAMTESRGFHTATLLADGRVLITGGDPGAWDSSGPNLSTAEVYDPKTGKFTLTGSMTIGRAWHTATLLSDGRVLVTGGTEFGSASIASAEIYDPKTGKFTATGPMTDGRIYHTATLLANGRVLVAGGCGNGQVYAVGNFLASAEIYDPMTGRFTVTGSMVDMRTFQQATLLADGRVLVTAGEGEFKITALVVTPLASAEIYDPKTGTFSPAGQGG